MIPALFDWIFRLSWIRGFDATDGLICVAFVVVIFVSVMYLSGGDWDD